LAAEAHPPRGAGPPPHPGGGPRVDRPRCRGAHRRGLVDRPLPLRLLTRPGPPSGGPSTPTNSRGNHMNSQPPAWEQRILDTREAINRAIAAHDQAIADAKMAAAPVSQIARVLGRQDRTGLYRAIQRARERTMQAVPQPPHTPVAYVRTRQRASDLR